MVVTTYNPSTRGWGKSITALHSESKASLNYIVRLSVFLKPNQIKPSRTYNFSYVQMVLRKLPLFTVYVLVTGPQCTSFPKPKTCFSLFLLFATMIHQSHMGGRGFSPHQKRKVIHTSPILTSSLSYLLVVLVHVCLLHEWINCRFFSVNSSIQGS